MTDKTLEYRTENNIPYHSESATSANSYLRERCLLDLYHPIHSTGYSTVVWFHGGGLNSGERCVPCELQENRLAVAAVGYRLHPKARSPSYIEDAAAAVAWVFHNIERFGGDPGRIFLAGHSAGSYLIAMIALDKRWLAPHGVDPDRLAGVIPLSGQMITHMTVREERGIPPTQVVVDDLAPIHHVRPDAPPILAATGDRDLEFLGRYEENAYFWRMLQVVGHKRATLHEMKGCDHVGMMAPSFPILLDFIRSRESEMSAPPGIVRSNEK